jgi:hypothetical protein
MMPYASYWYGSEMFLFSFQATNELTAVPSIITLDVENMANGLMTFLGL